MQLCVYIYMSNYDQDEWGHIFSHYDGTSSSCILWLITVALTTRPRLVLMDVPFLMYPLANKHGHRNP